MKRITIELTVTDDIFEDEFGDVSILDAQIQMLEEFKGNDVETVSVIIVNE